MNSDKTHYDKRVGSNKKKVDRVKFSGVNQTALIIKNVRKIFTKRERDILRDKNLKLYRRLTKPIISHIDIDLAKQIIAEAPPIVDAPPIVESASSNEDTPSSNEDILLSKKEPSSNEIYEEFKTKHRGQQPAQIKGILKSETNAIANQPDPTDPLPAENSNMGTDFTGFILTNQFNSPSGNTNLEVINIKTLLHLFKLLLQREVLSDTELKNMIYDMNVYFELNSKNTTSQFAQFQSKIKSYIRETRPPQITSSGATSSRAISLETKMKNIIERINNLLVQIDCGEFIRANFVSLVIITLLDKRYLYIKKLTKYAYASVAFNCNAFFKSISAFYDLLVYMYGINSGEKVLPVNLINNLLKILNDATPQQNPPQYVIELLDDLEIRYEEYVIASILLQIVFIYKRDIKLYDENAGQLLYNVLFAVGGPFEKLCKLCKVNFFYKTKNHIYINQLLPLYIGLYISFLIQINDDEYLVAYIYKICDIQYLSGKTCYMEYIKEYNRYVKDTSCYIYDGSNFSVKLETITSNIFRKLLFVDTRANISYTTSAST